MKPAIALILFFLLAPAPSRAETYNKWVEKCGSYTDVAAWLNQNFRYEQDRNGNGQPFSKGTSKRPRIQTPEETFRCRCGGTLDASIFAKETLNRINPDYRAVVIYLSLDRSQTHYLCGFFLGGKLFVMDYGNPYENMMGTNGPFENLDDYAKNFYLRRNPAQKKPPAYGFAFPSVSLPKAR
jgi:hypothetical protein